MKYDFVINTSNEDCLNNVIQYTDKGSIIVFHDSHKALEKLKYILPKVLQHFAEAEYSFQVIPEN